MCLIDETGDRAPINVQAGGAGGCQPSLPQILGNSDLLGSRGNFGKANFYKSFHFSFRLSFSFKDIFLFYGLSRRGKVS